MGALVVEQSKIESEFPPSTANAVPLPPKGTAFGFCICFMGWLKRDGFFLGSCFTVARVVGMLWLFLLPYICVHTKNPTSFEVGFLILDFSIYILSFTWVIVAAITW